MWFYNEVDIISVDNSTTVLLRIVYKPNEMLTEKCIIIIIYVNVNGFTNSDLMFMKGVFIVVDDKLSFLDNILFK